MRIDENMGLVWGNGRYTKGIMSLQILCLVNSSLPIVAAAHSQRSENGKSPGWRSCWVEGIVGMRGATEERCAYPRQTQYGVVWAPQQCGMPSAGKPLAASAASSVVLQQLTCPVPSSRVLHKKEVCEEFLKS